MRNDDCVCINCFFFGDDAMFFDAFYGDAFLYLYTTFYERTFERAEHFIHALGEVVCGANVSREKIASHHGEHECRAVFANRRIAVALADNINVGFKEGVIDRGNIFLQKCTYAHFIKPFNIWMRNVEIV